MQNKKIYLMYPKKVGRIAPEVYGHFTENIGGVFYDGLWVGKHSEIPNIKGFRKEIIEKLRQIKAPVLRWPGGCFAETYDWRDGIGENRPTRMNWWTYRDNRYDPNEVGTHEFMDLCEATGAKAYFAANITSVPILHIQQWMDYCLSPRGSTTLALEREKNGHPEPFDIPYWGVGNENWGGGGNMIPQHYVNEFKSLAMIMHNFFPQTELYICGSDADDYRWTDQIMRCGCNHLSERDPSHEAFMHGFAMHYYCGKAGDPLTFDDDQWTQQLWQAAKMETIIERNWHIISAYNPTGGPKLVIDEWGCWHPEGSGPSKGYNLFEQQSTLRDAVVTALTLNIFNNHCDKIRMTNVAQLCNNLHALFLAGGENCITTPTYHVYDLFKEHQGAECIETLVTDNQVFEDSLSVSASQKDGKTLLTVANLSCREDALVTLEAVGVAPLKQKVKAKMLYNADIHAHNTFEDPQRVVPEETVVDLSAPFAVPRASILAITF